MGQCSEVVGLHMAAVYPTAVQPTARSSTSSAKGVAAPHVFGHSGRVRGEGKGGTISLSGVYGGTADPLPMMVLFDKQIQLRMGQANVKRWIDAIMPLLTGEGDPLGVETFATHRLPIDDAPQAYENFQQKKDGTVKVLLRP
jgi:threonine dehydrogenase-like Zn-dependent dehydrogenase